MPMRKSPLLTIFEAKVLQKLFRRMNKSEKKAHSSGGGSGHKRRPESEASEKQK